MPVFNNFLVVPAIASQVSASRLMDLLSPRGMHVWNCQCELPVWDARVKCTWGTGTPARPGRAKPGYFSQSARRQPALLHPLALPYALARLNSPLPHDLRAFTPILTDYSPCDTLRVALFAVRSI